MSPNHCTFINKLRKPLKKGTLSPFLYEGFKEYQNQRRIRNEKTATIQ
jgi:hypothetical protein